MVLEYSHCCLGYYFHINHVIMFFTIFSNRYILPEYIFIVFLIFPGLKCGFLFLLILSPTLSLIFWLLFNSFGCWFPIMLFRTFTWTLARPCLNLKFEFHLLHDLHLVEHVQHFQLDVKCCCNCVQSLISREPAVR